MLDALLAEARLRWGLDPGAGVQLVAGERLIGTPIEPSRPVLIVPAALLKPAASNPDVVVAAVAARDQQRATAFATKHGIAQAPATAASGASGAR